MTTDKMNGTGGSDTHHYRRPPDHRRAETAIYSFFPGLRGGMDVYGEEWRIEENNRANKFAIDWAVTAGGVPVGYIDTELKPGWSERPYCVWTLARHSMGYNAGVKQCPSESGKIRWFRRYPHRSFWMAISRDMDRAAIVQAATFLASDTSKNPLHERGRAQIASRIPGATIDTVRAEIEVYKVSASSSVQCAVNEEAIEDFVIDALLSAREKGLQ